MKNQIELFKNQLENTINMNSQEFSKNLNNQLNAEKLGYNNSSNETIFKGSNFIDDSFIAVSGVNTEKFLVPYKYISKPIINCGLVNIIIVVHHTIFCN